MRVILCWVAMERIVVPRMRASKFGLEACFRERSS